MTPAPLRSPATRAHHPPHDALPRPRAQRHRQLKRLDPLPEGMRRLPEVVPRRETRHGGPRRLAHVCSNARRPGAVRSSCRRQRVAHSASPRSGSDSSISKCSDTSAGTASASTAAASRSASTCSSVTLMVLPCLPVAGPRRTPRQGGEAGSVRRFRGPSTAGRVRASGGTGARHRLYRPAGRVRLSGSMHQSATAPRSVPAAAAHRRATA